MVDTGQDLGYTEFQFNHDVDFATGGQYEEINRSIVALLNTSGGLIICTSDNDITDSALDKWVRDLRQKLQVFLTADDCIRYISTLKLSDKVVRMWIKKANRFITLHPHLYVRVLAETHAAYESVSLSQILSSKPFNTLQIPMQIETDFEYGGHFNYPEGPCLELKYSKDARTMTDFKELLNNERTRKALFAIPNNHAGGHLIYGVEESKEKKCNIVKGQYFDLRDQELFESHIITILEQGIWGGSNSPPVLGGNVIVQFLPVKNCPGEQTYIISIHLKYCPGGVFMKQPETYRVSESGLIEQVPFKEWKRRIQKMDAPAMKQHPPSPAYRLKHAHKHMSMEYSWRAVYNQEWSVDLIESGDIQHGHIHQITEISEYFKPKSPLNFSPSLSQMLKRMNTSMDIDIKVLKSNIKSKVCDPGFAIVACGWIANLSHSTRVVKPTLHVLDVFVMEQSSQCHLWCIVKEKGNTDEQQKQEKYVLDSGRLTKMKLMECDIRPDTTPHAELNELNIKSHLYRIDTNETISSKEVRFIGRSDTFDTWRERLAFLLLEENTPTKSALSDDHAQVLLKKQVEGVIVGDKSERFVFIEGPPGTGKSQLIVNLCKCVNSKSCVFISASKTLKNFINQNVECNVIHTDNLFHTISELSGIRHVLINIQGMVMSQNHWNRVFDKLFKTGCTVYLFANSRYVSLTSRHMLDVKQWMMDFCQLRNTHFQCMSFHKVHLSQRKIVSFIRGCFQGIMAYPDAFQITGTHLEDGEDVEVIGLSNIRQPGGENKLFRFVSSLVQKVLKKHPDIIYRLSDAAILVDTEDAEKDVDIFISIFTSEGMNVARASDTSTDALTIDTLDHFKELEAKVCVIVLPEDAWEEKSLSDRNMLNPRYRAYTASHATVLVVYITERHDHPTVISGMGFDVIPAPKPPTSTSCDSNIEAGEQIAKLVWHILGTDWITDLAFLHDNDHGHVIFYITKGGHCGFVTMSGTEDKYHQIAYSLNHNAIEPHRVSSSPSRKKMVMTYQEGGQRGNWWWSAYELNRHCNSWKYSGPYPLDDAPISTALSEKGVTTFLLQKSATREYYLRIYRSASGIEEANIKLTSPGHIAVRSDEELFITDQQNIWVFRWQTRQLSLFCRSLNNPYALCVDDSGHVYASHGRIFQEKISMFHFINKEPHRHIITHDASDIRAISVAPGYLAIGTTTGLQLCHSVQ